MPGRRQPAPSALTFREQFAQTAVVGSETFIDSNLLTFSGALSSDIVTGSPC